MNFTAADGPLYQGCASPQDTILAVANPLKVVTFNIKYSIEIDKALEVLTQEPALADPDILLLQEMEEGDVERIARTLGMC